MNELSFEARLAAHGLKLSEREMARVEELVRDLDRAAALVRGLERSYMDEPSNVFRLEVRPAGSAT